MPSQFDAMIFDMDGTLLDSMTYWRRINVDFLAARGLEPPEEIRADIMDISNRICAKVYARDFNLDMSAEQILDEYRRRMGVYYQSEIMPKPHALDYVRHLKRSGVRTCVLTASPTNLAIPALDRHGLYEEMEFVLSSSDLQMDKGDGAVYDLTAEKLNLPARRCAMFEDALYAARGAKNAGLTVYAISDSTQRMDQNKLKKIADRYIHDFSELLSFSH